MQAKSANMAADLVRRLAQAWAMKQPLTIFREFRRRGGLDVCALCDQATSGGRLCRQCLRELPWNNTFCECCGKMILTVQPSGVICEVCQAKRPPFARARAPMIYEFPVDALVKAIKFRRQLWYVPACAELLLPVLQKEFADVDALVPVPLHRWRHMKRGFNQAKELCHPLHQATGLPVLTIAIRIRATAAQTGG